MNSQDYQSKRDVLQESEPVNLSFLSCDELPHFYGYDLESSGDRIPIDVNYDDVPFHCIINLYQKGEKFITFRHVSADIKDGKIVSWNTIGIPDQHEKRLRKRVIIIYRMIYPNGLTIEDMEIKR